MDETSGFVPSKTCPSCEREFSWKKKWSDCWHRVVYCGPGCRRQATGSAKSVADERPEAAE